MRNLEEDLRDALQSIKVKPERFSFENVWDKYHHEQPDKRRATKKWLLIGIPVVFVLCGMTAAASSFLSNYTQNLKNAKQATGIFEYVNGKPITNQEFQSFKVGQDMVAQMDHKALPSEVDIIQRFNFQQVAYQEAVKEHLDVTDQQALTYSLKMKQMMENLPADADKANFAQTQQVLKAEEQGLGVSDNQYWTQVAPPAYKMGMSIGNLKRHFFTTYQKEHPGVQFQKAQDAWNQYNAKLLSEATIKQVQH